jgi:hypothetical protein
MRQRVLKLTRSIHESTVVFDVPRRTQGGCGLWSRCMPEGITTTRFKEVFEGFMRDYPGLQSEPGLDHPELIIGMALFRAYPCPGALK